MGIGDVDSSAINTLMAELKKEAVAFLSATEGDKEKWYIKSASTNLTEANARAVMADYANTQKQEAFKGTVDGKRVKLWPRSPQRKMDGRGAQMNFWLKIDNDYHKNYNMHVNVVLLETAFKKKFKMTEDGWERQAKEAERLGNEAAQTLREDRDWAIFAKK